MDREALHELIEKGQLEEALGLLLGQYQGGKLEKEVRLLQARYREARTQRDQGVVSWEQFNLEQNRLIKAMLYLGEEDTTPAPAGRKIRSYWLLGLAALLVLAGVFYWQWSASNKDSGQAVPPPAETPAGTPTLAAPSSAEILATVKSTLSEQPLEFAITDVSFLLDRQYQSFLARLTRRFVWRVSIPCRLEAGDIRITFDSTAQKLIATTGPVLLGTNFFVYDKTNTTKSNSAWIEESSMDGEFWRNINGTTMEQANARLRTDEGTRFALKIQAVDVVEMLIRKALQKLKLDSLGVEVVVQKARLYDGAEIAL
ncbi:MAG: hypothetical protein KDD02_14160 [Phaeodactylibacter sp.]|nr:hypothetical protein [Phaeodactylibacter sp.]MCB9301134.1 hypothetical protein [Lewinellaceae bacterium]